MAKTNKWGRPAMVLAALLAWQSCLTYTSSVRQARELFKVGDYDQASEILQQAALENPKSDEIKTMLFRAKLNSYYYHLLLARQKAKLDEREAATRRIPKGPGRIPRQRPAAGRVRRLQPSGARSKRKKPSSRPSVPPVQLNIKKDEKVSLNLKNTPITNIFKSLGRTFNVNFIFDKDFRDFLHSLEIENTTFFDVLKVLCMVSSFAVPGARSRIRRSSIPIFSPRKKPLICAASRRFTCPTSRPRTRAR